MRLSLNNFTKIKIKSLTLKSIKSLKSTNVKLFSEISINRVGIIEVILFCFNELMLPIIETQANSKEFTFHSTTLHQSKEIPKTNVKLLSEKC